MSAYNDLYYMIKDIIKEETLYLRHYIGQVVNNIDPLRKGRLFVTIPDLGLILPSTAIWCFPRQGSGMSIPAIGSYIEIYFINGDRTKPVYLYPASEIADNIPVKYDGNPTTNVIWEDANIPANNIKFDGITQQLTFLDGVESYVKGDTFKIELQKLVNAVSQLQIDFTNWTPVANDGGAALKTQVTSGFLTKIMPILTNILSLFIKGK